MCEAYGSERFTGRAGYYEKGRPEYAADMIHDIVSGMQQEHQEKPAFTIADIGAGTGKFTKQLLEALGGTKTVADIFCAEPNNDMRKAAKEKLSQYANCHIVDGSAAATTLAGGSVDYVTAAQAFHWFDVEQFRCECRRILKNGGTVFLIWNIRDMQTGFVQELCDIYKKYCPFFKGLSGGIERDDKRIGAFFTDGYTRKEYPNDITYTKESFIDRSLSASYSLRPQDELFQEYREELEKLFDSYADDGVAIMSNKTVVYSGKMGRE